MCKRAGIGKDRIPRQRRHTFISLMSYTRMPGTETVYMHELWPVIRTGANAMDRLLPAFAAPDHPK
jgi:hypothetical protein